MAKWVDLSQKNKTKRNELEKFPQVIKQLLANRGIQKAQEARKFFEPSLDKLYSPTDLKETEKAAQGVLDAIDKGQKVFIHGDFDVDGVCATSILWDFLYNYIGASILPYIPDRFDEGYGMSEKTLKAIKEEGGDLVITVDCGIKDLDLIKKWKKKGLDFVITDHHTLFKDKKGKDKVSSAALANVHPAHPNGKYPFRDLSGTAVAWKLVQVVAKKIREDQKLSKKYKRIIKIDESDYLDLVAIATVCDIMPLVDENRILVANGLKQIKKTARVGLVKLIIESNLDIENIDAYHVGFVIGPRLNAAGRLGHAMDAVRLLTTRSMSKAQDLAKKLSDLNSQRQRLTKEMVEKAREQVIKVQ